MYRGLALAFAIVPWAGLAPSCPLGAQVLLPPTLAGKAAAVSGPPELGAVRDIHQQGETTWLIAADKLLTVVDDELKTVSTGETGSSSDYFCIEQIPGRLLIGTSSGVLEVGPSGIPRRVQIGAVDSLKVLFLVYDEATKVLWIGSDQGTFSLQDGASAVEASASKSAVTWLGQAAGRVLVSDLSNTYFANDTVLEPISDEHAVARVVDVAEAAAGAYLLVKPSSIFSSGYSLFRYPDHLQSPLREGVLDIGLFDGHLAFSIGTKVYVFRNDQVSEVFGTDDAGVFLLEELGGFQWAITDHAVWRRSKGEPSADFRLIAQKPGRFRFSRGVELAGVSWFLGDSGAVRVHEDIRLQPALNSTWGFVFGRTVRVESVSYAGSPESWGPFSDSHFECILATDKASLAKRKADADYSRLPVALANPGKFRVSIFVSVRDRYGNLQEPFPQGKKAFLAFSKLGFDPIRMLLFLLFPILVFPFSLYGRIPKRKRLWLFSAWTQYPIANWALVPALGWSIAVFRELYFQIHGQLEDAATEDLAAEERIFENLAERPERFYALTAEDLSADVTLDSLFVAAFAQSGDKLRHLIPVRVRFDHHEDLDGTEIKSGVEQRMWTDFPIMSKKYIAHIFRSGNILLLFSYDSRIADVANALKAFQETHLPGSWMVLHDIGLESSSSSLILVPDGAIAPV